MASAKSARISVIVISIPIIASALLALIFIPRQLESERAIRTESLVMLLDVACKAYQVDYGAYPPTDSFVDSRALHFYLGRDTRNHPEKTPPCTYCRSGHEHPPFITFRRDMLEGASPNIRPEPPRRIIDEWERPIEYRNPGVKNPDGVDIWSVGGDGLPDSQSKGGDDITNWEP